MGIGIAAFILVVLYGLPFFARKAASHPQARRISVEDQSRILIAAILSIVWLAAGLKVQVIIAADLLSTDIPALYRDEPVKKAIAVFRGCNCHAFPVLEATDEGDYYVGLILLKDILPDLPVRSNT